MPLSGQCVRDLYRIHICRSPFSKARMNGCLPTQTTAVDAQPLHFFQQGESVNVTKGFSGMFLGWLAHSKWYDKSNRKSQLGRFCYYWCLGHQPTVQLTEPCFTLVGFNQQKDTGCCLAKELICRGVPDHQVPRFFEAKIGTSTVKTWNDDEWCLAGTQSMVHRMLHLKDLLR